MLTRIRFSGLDRMIVQKSPTPESLPVAMITRLVAAIAIATAITGASRAKPIRRRTFMPSLASTGHRGAELLGGDAGGVEGADQPAAQDDLDPVGETDQLVEVGGDQQHGQARRAGRRLMCSQIAAWAPTSTPRVGWAAISTTGSPLISRPTISFCWLPPDSARASVSMPGVRTSYSSTMRSVSSRAPPRSIHGPRALGGRVWWPEHAVLPQRRVEQQAVPLPVLGDVADAGLAAVRGCPSR